MNIYKELIGDNDVELVVIGGGIYVKYVKNVVVFGVLFLD